MHRRTFLALASSVLVSCHSPPKREAVLDGLVRSVLVPETAIVESKSTALETAAKLFTARPAVETLEGVRAEWKEATLAWKRTYGYRAGTLVDTGALVRASFWPPRTAAIDALVSGTSALDDGAIDELGVDVKGLFALEYLLFGRGESTPAILERFTSPEGERRRAVVSAFASNVRKWSGRARKAMDSGDAYSKKLAGKGQASVSHLVSQMIDATESMALRLRGVVDRAGSDVEGTPSGLSSRIVVAVLDGARALYAGNGADGLAVLVKHVSPDADARAQSAFEAALSAVRALTEPLDVAARTKSDAYGKAVTATKALEVALKTEVTTALGVTLTWTKNDGD